MTSEDGRLSIEIPAGALDHDVVVAIDEVEDGPDGMLGGGYTISSGITQLRAPATVTYDFANYDNAEDGVTLHADTTQMQNIALVTQDADGWNRMADHNVDEDAELVHASALYLGSYAIVLQ